MPNGLNASKPILEQKIYEAFNKMTIAASNPSATSESVNQTSLLLDLSKDLADAIHSYTKQANVVVTSVNVTTGAPAAVQVVVPAGTGATLGPVVSAGTGTGELK